VLESKRKDKDIETLSRDIERMQKEMVNKDQEVRELFSSLKTSKIVQISNYLYKFSSIFY